MLLFHHFTVHTGELYNDDRTAVETVYMSMKGLTKQEAVDETL